MVGLTLAGIPDHYLERAIVEYVDDRLRSGGGTSSGSIDPLPEGARALYLTWIVESEVINNGFVSCFGKRSERFAQQAIEAFEFFSAREHARVVREAYQVYLQDCGNGVILNAGESSDSPESWRLQILEDYFVQIDDSLSALRIAKVRAHPQAFCEPASSSTNRQLF